MAAPDDAELLAYYERGGELDRLERGQGLLEFERTKEIINRHLPDAPAVVADIGGGPGRYALWLTSRGYTVRHRDVMPLHVEQFAAASQGAVETVVGDATALDLEDASVDAVLLLGPLYHLRRRADRLTALSEAARVVRPSGPIFVAAISRWAARTSAVLAERLYHDVPELVDVVEHSERTGFLHPTVPGWFTSYTHRPKDLAREVRAAGLELVDLVTVEGPAALMADLAERMDDPADRQAVLETSRALERVPEVMGIGPHFVATARRPG